MTPRSLFNIILKVLGIFFIKDILGEVARFLSDFMYMIKSGSYESSLWLLIFTLLILVIYACVIYYLVFKTEYVIEWLKLDRGFDEETIPLNIHRSTILSIAIIVIGGLLIANEIPNFCRLLYAYYLQSKQPYDQVNPNVPYAILAFCKIIVGLILIGNQRHMVNFIESHRKH